MHGIIPINWNHLALINSLVLIPLQDQPLFELRWHQKAEEEEEQKRRKANPLSTELSDC